MPFTGLRKVSTPYYYYYYWDNSEDASLCSDSVLSIALLLVPLMTLAPQTCRIPKPCSVAMHLSLTAIPIHQSTQTRGNLALSPAQPVACTVWCDSSLSFRVSWLSSPAPPQPWQLHSAKHLSGPMVSASVKGRLHLSFTSTLQSPYPPTATAYEKFFLLFLLDPEDWVRVKIWKFLPSPFLSDRVGGTERTRKRE